MATAQPPASTSYQTEKNLASLISGDTTSALSTVDTLSSLKLLRDLATDSTNSRDKASNQQVIQTETRYLKGLRSTHSKMYPRFKISSAKAWGPLSHWLMF